MNEAWEAAQLLEEIAKRADPKFAISRCMKRLAENPAGTLYSVAFRPDERSHSVTYFIPVQTVMNGIDGTPEEVLEWLGTGLDARHAIAIVEHWGKPCFALTRHYLDENAYRQLLDHLTKLVVSHGEQHVQKTLQELRRE